MYRLFAALVVLTGTVSAAPVTDDAATAFSQQDWARAAQLYEQVVRDQPTTPNLWRLGRAYLGLERYRDSKRALLRALSLTPNDPQTAFTLATALDHLHEEDAAFKYLDIAATQGLMPQMLETHPALGHLRKDPRFAGVVLRADKAIHVCKYDERYRAFDFWKGEWDGYTGSQKVLRDVIAAETEGCALREEWEGTDGGHGRSETYFNPKTKRWEQLWVDAGGNVVKLSGNVGDGEAKLEGENIDPTGVVHAMRQTWEATKDGHVLRKFEQSEDGGRTWNLVMQLELKRGGA
ncbi:MAG: tetratricopeptide repeat protein [Proteobacteria bacterium]|uniref:tetratricopeptide repeat protein n=1 Tax=Rudaea sp. TaxID=2136325 RepID=UPI0032203554|nr:tetratricopeptide repeat protein [Pseudomonadota bacterium]